MCFVFFVFKSQHKVILSVGYLVFYWNYSLLVWCRLLLWCLCMAPDLYHFMHVCKCNVHIVASFLGTEIKIMIFLTVNHNGHKWGCKMVKKWELFVVYFASYCSSYWRYCNTVVLFNSHQIITQCVLWKIYLVWLF